MMWPVKAPKALAHVTASLRGFLADTVQPLPQCAVLEQEYAHFHGTLPEGYPAKGSDSQRLGAIHAAMHRQRHVALCLSGGGIRSASFAVGVLQGLARRGVLGACDYLSTVSGGGYTGAWLSAWLFHASEAGQSTKAVFDALGGLDGSAARPEPEPVRRIREYSNYLDPKLGLFSADVWALIATVVRNLLLNWLVLLPLLSAALLVPRVYFSLVSLGTQHWLAPGDLRWWSTWLMLVGFGLLAVSLIYVVLDIPSGGDRQGGQSRFLGLCFGPLCVATAAFTLYWAWSRTLDADAVRLRDLLVIGAAGHLGVWLLTAGVSRRRWRPWTWMAAAVSGAAAGLGAWWFAVHLFALPLARSPLFAAVGVPVILAILGASGTLFVGLASGDTSDEDREWWSRFGAWLLIGGAAWLAASGVVFVGPMILNRALEWLNVQLASPVLAKALVGTITALTGGVAARTGRQTPRGSATGDARLRRIAFALAAPTFVLLLLMLLATVNVALLSWLDALQILPEYPHPEGAGLPEIGVLIAALLAGGLLMGLFVAVNKFSLHGMYRNRLIRAFLGASRPKNTRHPNRFSGFDPADNVILRELAQGGRRPLHIVNMALNLVADNRLAWQERKAESFTVSPLAAGTSVLGYRPIAAYGSPRGMSLGTAITISGAAVSPTMGSQSSPALAFLLTLFNARLGVWLGNPGAAGRFTWKTGDPRMGAAPLLREMLGRTTDANPYVYLSDGGHFENLGLYEMVARRCHYIIVSDAGCDPRYAFEDLGNAIRKIRIDLGIPIDFPNGLGLDAERVGKGNHHGAIGTIGYAAVDGKDVEPGVLVYLKATLSGDEPVDVRNYAAAHDAFPHESTADQWFGESQFESYRVLGVHTIDAIAGDAIAGDAIAGSDDGQARLQRLVATMTARLAEAR